MSADASPPQMVLLTEKCVERNCGTRVRHGELTDDENTHWHIRPGIALVPAGVALREAADVLRVNAAEAWGGDRSWLTTGTHVANLAADWLDEVAAQIEAHPVSPRSILAPAADLARALVVDLRRIGGRR